MPRTIGSAPRSGRGLLVAALAVALAGCGTTAPTPAAPASSDPSVGGPTSAPPSVAPATSSGATPAPPVATPTDVAPPSVGAWAQLAIEGSAPSAREDHTWTVDAEGRLAYLFGGRRNGKALDDLWTFDLATGQWTRLETSGPGPAARFGHDAAWVPGRGLVVTLGQAGSRFFDDIWLFDPSAASWRELPAAGNVPVPRYGACSGLGPDGRLWISHGFTEDGIRFSDTVAYDFGAEAWVDETPLDGAPRERCLHACWWTADGELVLYGGQTTGVPALGDLWVLSTSPSAANHWREIGNPGPDARQLAAAARWGPLTIVFGGRDLARKPLRDTWLLLDSAVAPGSTGQAFVRLPTPGDRPPARSGAALIADAARDRLLLFGGVGSSDLGDLWALTLD